jgi:hypothetical protein
MIRILQNNQMLHNMPETPSYSGTPTVARTVSAFVSRRSTSASESHIPIRPTSLGRNSMPDGSHMATVVGTPVGGSGPVIGHFPPGATTPVLATDGHGAADGDASCESAPMQELPPEVEALFGGHNRDIAASRGSAGRPPTARLRSQRGSSSFGEPATPGARTPGMRLLSLLSTRSGSSSGSSHMRRYSADEASALSALTVAAQHEPEGDAPQRAHSGPLATAEGSTVQPRSHQRTCSMPSVFPSPTLGLQAPR